MYEMYPEWGPARHRDEGDPTGNAVQTAMDLRDNGGFRAGSAGDSWGTERPDDN